MEREGVTPRETIIFEDSAMGLEAAKRSGAAYVKIIL
jgi:HAD superfamily hydrolase (TIGR01509 family)